MNTYSKPVINRIEEGITNKFACNPVSKQNIRQQIDNVSVDDLTNSFGSPLYVFSEETLRNKYKEMHRAFSTRYPDVQLAWSYKTNYLQAVCAVMHQEGAMAEVVSEMEYEKARSFGIPGEQIIFNGPVKSLKALEKALAEKALINIDHLDEIDDLETICQKQNCKGSVGIRINLDAGIYPQWSRFGFNLETGQALEAIKRIHNGGRLEIKGLHCHIGTYILDPSAYGRQVAKMAQFLCQVEELFGYSLEYLDIGGGFPSISKLKNSYLGAEISVPDIDEFADVICETLLTNLRPGHFPKLYLESGRALVDEAGTLITTVAALKRLPDGTRAYVVDAGVNLLFTSFWYKFNIETDRLCPGCSEHSVVYGSLCMNIDVLDEGVMLPPLERGTRLIISPVGAYNINQSMQFIHYRPNVVMIGKDKNVHLICEGEEFTNSHSWTEKVPEHLQSSTHIR